MITLSREAFMAEGLNRRQFLVGSAAAGGLAAGSALLASPAAAAQTLGPRSWTTRQVAPRSGGRYLANLAPLAPTAFLRLPP